MGRGALAALQKGGRDFRLNLIALALRGQSKGFEKVVKMIDDMVVLLGKEQVADDDKKAFCEAELDKAEDKLKGLDIKIADLEKALDKEVADATQMRKEEHQENEETVANDSAAKQ